jgi:peptidyl-tRNA hydrolase
MKLYLVVRGDLRPGQQLAQACHGALAFARDHPEIWKRWEEKSNTLVVVTAKDVDDLHRLSQQAYFSEIKSSYFTDPDLDPPLTCLALEPGQKAAYLCKALPLALRQLAA